MYTKMKLNLSKTCRACLTENGADIMFPLADVELKRMYLICTSIEIPADDTGPNLLCKTCNNKCQRMYKFRLQALASEKKIIRGSLAVKEEEEELSDRDESAETPHATSMVEIPSATQTVIKQEKEDDAAKDMAGDKNKAAPDDDLPVSSPLKRKYREPARPIVKRETPSAAYKKFSKRGQVSQFQHMEVKRVNPDIPFHCPLCNGAFTTFAFFKTHFQHEHENDVLPIRNNDPTFWKKMCLTCGLQVGPKETLLSHTVVKHMRKDLSCVPIPKKFKCELCPRQFSLRHARDVHWRVHKTVWEPKGLTEHTRNHHHLQFKCEHCPQYFGTLPKLEQHLLVHSLKNSYFCKVCHQKFSALTDARRHISILHRVERTEPLIRKTHERIKKPINCNIAASSSSAPIKMETLPSPEPPQQERQPKHSPNTAPAQSPPEQLPLMREGQPIFLGLVATETADDDDIVDEVIEEMTSDEEGI